VDVLSGSGVTGRTVAKNSSRGPLVPWGMLVVLLMAVSVAGYTAWLGGRVALALAPAPVSAPSYHRQAKPGTASRFSPSVPVMFIENVGQWDERIGFQVWGGPGDAMWIARDGTIWLTVVTRSNGFGGAGREPSSAEMLLSAPEPGAFHSQPFRGVNIRITFAGANPHPRVEPLAPLDTVVNYFIGNDGAKWRTHVPVWSGVRYVDLYPGVDLEMMGSENGGWQWRLICRVGCSDVLPRVSLRVEGAQQVNVNVDGEGPSECPGQWYIVTETDTLSLPLIRVHSENPIPLRSLHSESAVVYPLCAETMSVSNETSSSPVVSSPRSGPTLLYSTFIGGSQTDGLADVDLGDQGEIYLVGWSSSANFPVTPGAFDTTYGGGTDAFVLVLNESGETLLSATFLGGSGWDVGKGVYVDDHHDVYVVGTTSSVDFPISSGAFDTTHNGGTDVFISKLVRNEALAYSTYIGGSRDDHATRMIVRDALYIVGQTNSSDFPHTAGPSFHSGYCDDNGARRLCWDAFVMKIGRTNGALEYSRLLGGSSDDIAKDVGIAPDGMIYVAGVTSSSDFPTTYGVIDRTYGGEGEGFLIGLYPGSSHLELATFLGGSWWDAVNALSVDPGSGNVYLTGETRSADFLVTSFALDRTFGGGTCIIASQYRPCPDAFLVMMDARARHLLYSTFVGSNAWDGSTDFILGADGTIYMTGGTRSTNFPVSNNAYDRTWNGDTDVFLTILSVPQSSLIYSTYLGGQGWDFSLRMKSSVDMSKIFLLGDTWSTDFPTANAFDRSHNGRKDGFLVVFQNTLPPVPTNTPTPTPTFTPTPTPTIPSPTFTPTPTLTPTSTPTPTVYPDQYEPDDNCSQARWLYLGTPQHHNFHDISDVDWLKFTVIRGATYAIETYYLESNADTVLELYAPNCTARIAFDDDGGPGLGSRIEWQATASGTYKARVRPLNNAHTGRGSGYTVVLRQVAPAWSGKVAVPLAWRGHWLSPCWKYEPNDDRRVNPWGPLQFGVTYMAYLCREDKEDNYYVEVPRAGTVEVVLSLPPSLVGVTAIWGYRGDSLGVTMCGTGPVSEAAFRMRCGGVPRGRFVVRVYTADAERYYDEERPYGLRVTLP